MISFLKNLNSKPRALFIIDGFGALVSAFFIGFVLVKFQPFIGLSKSTLYFLAVFPTILIVYNVYCYFRNPIKVLVCLKIIAFLNLFYCFLSIAIILYNYNSITKLGLFYFGLEILVLLLLFRLEFSVVHKISN